MELSSVSAFIALLVGGVWAVVALASIYTRDYTALTITTPVMVAVIGVIFGDAARRRKNGNGGRNG